MSLRVFLPLIFLLAAGRTILAQELPAGPASAIPSPSGAAADLLPPAEHDAGGPDEPAAPPLLVPIPPAGQIPFATAEYRSDNIPWQPFPTAAAPSR